MNSRPSPAFAIDETTLLGELGIVVPRQIVCRTSAAIHGARMACNELPGERVVLKVTTPFIPHKTEVGAVRIVPRDEETIARAIGDLALRLDATEVAVSEWIDHDTSPGGEILLSLRWSSEFGPLVTFGAGGTSTEVLSSAVALSPSLTGDPLTIVNRLPFTRLVTGHRNQRPRVAPGELRTLLSRCLEFASARLPHSGADIEINPLVPSFGKLYALDVLVSPRTPFRASIERPLDKIDALLHPRSVAILGVSSTGVNAGRIIARNLTAHARTRTASQRVTIVKEGTPEIDGVECVPRLEDLDPVDLLVLSIPADQVPAAIDAAIERQAAQSIIVIPGGLGEHEGSEDLERQVRESVARSRGASWRGPVINGANCLGVRSPDVDTIFLPREKWVPEHEIVTPLALVSQSGALAAAMVSRLAPLAPRYLVSLGNQIDLTAGDYLRHFEQKSDVDVVAFYVEGFAADDGRLFMETARRLVSAGRQVILYRAGRTSAGRQASSSHTAAIAGDAAVARQLACAAGVMFAESLEDFTDLVRLSVLLGDRIPRGLRLGVMSNAGFEAVAFADNHGPLDLAAFSKGTSHAISQILREQRLERIVTVANPLDVNPLLDDQAFARVAELVLGDDGIDLGVIGCVPLTGSLKTLPAEAAAPESVVSRLVSLRTSVEKPWVAVVDAGRLYDPMAGILEAARIPVFRSADRATRLLATWATCRLRED